MSDTITVLLGVVTSLLVGFGMADDAGYAKACSAGRSLKYLRTPIWKRMFML
jgi:hypothetical protein